MNGLIQFFEFLINPIVNFVSSVSSAVQQGANTTATWLELAMQKFISILDWILNLLNF